MGIVKDIHKEWKENAEANEPMPDPDDHVNPPSLRHVMSQSPLNHIKAIREAMKLYKKTIFDSKEAIREAQVDDEFIKQAETTEHVAIKKSSMTARQVNREAAGRLLGAPLRAI